MPKAKHLLNAIATLLTPWGWGVIATAFSIALILFVTWGGTL